jgi:hypothetical protein
MVDGQTFHNPDKVTVADKPEVTHRRALKDEAWGRRPSISATIPNRLEPRQKSFPRYAYPKLFPQVDALMPTTVVQQL